MKMMKEVVRKVRAAKKNKSTQIVAALGLTELIGLDLDWFDHNNSNPIKSLKGAPKSIGFSFGPRDFEAKKMKRYEVIVTTKEVYVAEIKASSREEAIKKMDEKMDEKMEDDKDRYHNDSGYEINVFEV